MTPRLTRRFALGLALAALPALALAADPTFSTPKGWAIRGYDPVAYFKSGEAVAGVPETAYDWNGATWLFSTQENLETFKADPAKYAPQYGGYCAYAVSQGYTAAVDPQAWKIVDGKLYLNYSKEVKALWEASQSRYIADADKNWPKVLQ